MGCQGAIGDLRHHLVAGVDNALQLSDVVAVDAATGALRWRFDSEMELTGPNRGVTYWAAGDDRRIFVGQGSYLYALDADNGFCLWSAGWSAAFGRYCFGAAIAGSYIAAGNYDHLYIYSL